MRLYKTQRLEDGTLAVVGELAGELDRETWKFIMPPGDVSTVDDNAHIMGREELESLPGGRRALLAWRAGDDSAHENSRITLFEQKIWDVDLRVHIKRGDPNAAELLAHASPKEKCDYLASHRLDETPETPEERQARIEREGDELHEQIFGDLERMKSKIKPLRPVE